MTSDDWSAPSFYSGSSPVVPPIISGADPIGTSFFDDWLSEEGSHGSEPQWGETRYVGRRSQRPSPGSRQSSTRTVTPDAAVSAEIETGEAADGADSADRVDRGILANSKAMAIANLISRITGFLRSSLLVAAIGLGQVGDAYNLGNNLPNMVYELLLGGVLSSVLIPLLVHGQEEDDDNGVAYTQRLLSIATAALAVMTILAVLAAPLIVSGFTSDHSQRSLATVFASLLLPEIFFYGIGAMFMAVLNIRHSFAAGAWSSVLNNVVMIVTLGIFFLLPGPKSLSPSTMTTAQIVVLGVGTTLGIAVQALVLIPALRRTGFRWQWRFRARPNEIGRMKEVGTLAGWVLAYVVASQIGVTVIAEVGIRHKAFATFTNADLLIQMPYGILVVSLLTALMPRLSRAAARGQTDDVIDDLGLGARLAAVALIPITVGLMVLGQVLSVVLFAYHATTISEARIVGTALAVSAFGLFPFAIVMLQLRVFYAMRDGKTPALINAFMVGSKVLIVLIGAQTLHDPIHFAELLTVGTSASYVVGAIVGHVALTKRIGNLRFGAVGKTVGQIGLASLIGGGVALALVALITGGLGDSRGGSATALVVGGLVGLAVMAAVAWRLRIPEVRNLAGMVRG